LRFISFLLLSCIALETSTAQEPTIAQGGADAGPGVGAAPTWTQKFDQLWHRRDESQVEDQLLELVKAEQAKNQNHADVHLRLAAIYVWRADGFPDGSDAKAAAGKSGWMTADKAIEARPNEVGVHYYAAAGIGLYSEGVGILTALGEGLESKFRSRVGEALRLNADFLDGAPQVLWGRFFFKLPWPKRDVTESIKVLRATLKSHPRNLRGKLYLAEALFESGSRAEARQLVNEIGSAPLGEDPSEDRRIKAKATQWIARHPMDSR